MSRGRASSDPDYSKYAQFTYYPYGFGEFDEDPEVKHVEQIIELAKKGYPRSKMSEILEIPEYYIGVLINKHNIPWKDYK